MGFQVASDIPFLSHRGGNFQSCLHSLGGKTCNHVVAIGCHLIGSHFFEFVCLLSLGSIL